MNGEGAFSCEKKRCQVPSWMGEIFIFRFEQGSALGYTVFGAIALSTGPRMIGQNTAGCNYSTDHERQARLLSPEKRAHTSRGNRKPVMLLGLIPCSSHAVGNQLGHDCQAP